MDRIGLAVRALGSLGLLAGMLLGVAGHGLAASIRPQAGSQGVSLRERFKGLVDRDRIQPRWIDATRCWYVSREHSGARSFVLLDAAATEDQDRWVRLSGEQLDAAFKTSDAAIEHVDATKDPATLRVFLGNQTQWLLHARTAEAERIGDVAEYELGQGLGAKLRRPDSELSPRDQPAGGVLSPDGTHLAYIENSQLMLVQYYRGSRVAAPMAITDDGSPEREYSEPIRWSPSGQSLVCMLREPEQPHVIPIVDSSPDDRLQPKLLELKSYLKPGDRIERTQPRLFRATGDVDAPLALVPITNEELFANPWSIRKLRWEEDSSRFTFLYNERGHRVMRWIAVDAASGAARAIIDEAPATFFDYANKLYHRRLKSRGEVLWTSERSGWNHLYAIDAGTGSARAITSGEWLVRGVESVDPDERFATLRVMGRRPEEDPYHVHFARVHLGTGAITPLTHGDGTHEIEWSPDRRWYVDSYSRVDQPPVWELRSLQGGSLIATLERASAEPLLEAGWMQTQRFTAKGRDGATDIYGVVYRPTHWKETERYPIIESIYAGPHGAHVPKRWSVHRKPRELAELGFIVVQIDGMGTNWRSKAFHDVCWKNLGDAGFPDRIAWMRALAATDPTIDLERVGIYGGSAGGQNAMRALIAHGDFYDAAAADCGCHDNRMDKIWWNELWMSWPLGPHYDESSNVVQAHRMQGSLMLIVGELDRNVDPASTMQVVDALVKADKDFELLVLPGMGHGAGESAYGTRRRRDFFKRTLLAP